MRIYSSSLRCCGLRASVPWATVLLLAGDPLAFGSYLAMRFAGGGSEVTLGPTQTAVIEVTFTMTSSQTSKSRCTGVDARFDVGTIVPGVGGDYVLDGSDDFMVTDITPGNFANWNAGAAVLGPFNRLGFFLSAGDPAGVSGPVGDSTLQPPAVLASFTIRNDAATIADTAIVFHVDNNLVLPAVYNGPGQMRHAWQSAIPKIDNAFWIQQGNPGDADPRFQYHGYETLTPLIIHAVPEPGTVALASLAALALMGRVRDARTGRACP